jgi:hypothetical protein
MFGNLNSNVLSLQTVPSRLYIACKQSTLGTTSTPPVSPNIYGAPMTSAAYNETCACINSVSLTFNNSSGLLSNATPHDLYYISKKNGLKMSFAQWTANSYQTNTYAPSSIPLVNNMSYGSVLCIDPSCDLSLPPTLSAGVNGMKMP